MGDKSAIEWTDATWNPTTGCTKVSPACAHCYIERTPPFRVRGRKFVNGHIPLEFHESRLDAPLKRRRPTIYFVNSLSDLFHEDVPREFVDRVMLTIVRSVYHTFQILTKRPERMRDYFADPSLRARIDRLGLINKPLITPRGKMRPTIIRAWPLPTLWLGVSVENQHFADERIPLLIQTPAAVRFISAEPLLGPVDLKGPIERGLWDVCNGGSIPPKPAIDWVIVGAESGPVLRPTHPDWVRSLRDQCIAAGVPFFFKQWGGRTAKSGGRELDGREWSEMPQGFEARA